MNFTRRDFLKLSSLAGLTLFAPPAFGSVGAGKVLIMLELSGGNDGLNTVVPYTDPAYRNLRPNLALAPSDVRTLDDDVALHGSLSELDDAWEAGELAVVEGLGYPNPNRSHFRSIEIWEGATSADEYTPQGWISRVVPESDLNGYAPAGLVVGEGADGPLAGANALALDDPERLFQFARRLERVSASSTNPALQHIVDTQNELLDAVDLMKKYHDRAPSLASMFGSDRRLAPVRIVAELLASGLPLMAVKIRIGGFDTHVNQARQHGRLLEVVDGAVGALRRSLKSVGRWDDVLVMTYSEFGRRPRENGGGGTDHGTAAPHFVAGGAVKGGRYGEPPALDDLDANGDLRFTTDFRRLYATIARKWWAIDEHELNDFKVLGFV